MLSIIDTFNWLFGTVSNCFKIQYSSNFLREMSSQSHAHIQMYTFLSQCMNKVYFLKTNNTLQEFVDSHTYVKLRVGKSLTIQPYQINWVGAQHVLQDRKSPQQRLRSICVSMHSKQNLSQPSDERFDVCLHIQCTTMTDTHWLICAIAWQTTCNLVGNTVSRLNCPHLAFYVNLYRAVIGPSATLTGRWRPDIDLRRMLTGSMPP